MRSGSIPMRRAWVRSASASAMARASGSWAAMARYRAWHRAADLNLHATSLRVVAARRFAVLTVGAGAGWSKYTGDVTATFRNNDTGLPETIALRLDQSRTVIFADAGLDFKVLKIVGEIGHQSGRDQHLITNFQGFDDTKGTTFYSAGLRFGF